MSCQIWSVLLMKCITFSSNDLWPLGSNLTFKVKSKTVNTHNSSILIHIYIKLFISTSEIKCPTFCRMTFNLRDQIWHLRPVQQDPMLRSYGRIVDLVKSLSWCFKYLGNFISFHKELTNFLFYKTHYFYDIFPRI